MTQTVFGIAVDPIGHAAKSTLGHGPVGPELRYRAWATPSDEIRSVQDARIPIDRDHDGVWVGEVVYLERTDAGLWAVGHVSDEVEQSIRVRVADRTVAVAHDLFWSVETVGGLDYGFAITSIAITRKPARINATPLTLLPGALDHRSAADRWRGQVAPHQHQLLTRAASASLDRRGGPIAVRSRVRDDDDMPPLSSVEVARIGRARSTGGLRHTAPVRGSVLRVR